MSKLFNFLMMMGIITSVMPLSASCAKCAKIENERMEQQAQNPKPFVYYDDLVSMKKKESENKDSSKKEEKQATI